MPIPATIIAPWQLDNGEAGTSPAGYGRHMLAEGDSWFAYGSVLGFNQLNFLQFTQRTLITQTAMPGDTLDHMADWWRDSNFPSLIDGGSYGNRAWKFDAILLSGGGNDLIDAVSERYVGKRLLQLCSDGSPPTAAADCLREPAWDQFETYLRANFKKISDFVAVSIRNRDTPIFVHTYDYMTPRNAPAAPGFGPWLLPALQAHQVPPMLWQSVADLLVDRLRGVIRSLGLANVHVVDTVGTLAQALPGTTGQSNDWLNEIHPDKAGFRKLAPQWQQTIEGSIGA